MQKLVGTLSVAVLLVAGGPAVGEDIAPEMRAKIMEFMDMTGAKTLGEQMGNGIVQQMITNMKQASPDMPARGFDIVQEVTAEILRTETEPLFDELVPVYAKFFTEEDLDALIEFYGTATGQKVIRTMPALVNESMKIGGEWGQRMMPKIQEMIRTRLAAEGLETN